MFGLPPSTDVLASRLLRRSTDPAILQARDGLLARQQSDGYWIGEFDDAAGREAKFILLMTFLGRHSDPRIRQAVSRIRETQLPHGGWTSYPGGSPDLSISVQNYFALKLVGHRLDESHMLSAASVIRELGGASEADPTTSYFLALLGQIPFASCPAVPPELMLMPSWSSWNLSKVASWIRTSLVPISIIWAHQPRQTVTTEQSIRELFLGNPDLPTTPKSPNSHWSAWRNFFLRDRWVKRCERWGITPFRRRALRKAITWMRDHYIDSDGLGASFTSIMWNLIALRCLDVADDDPEFLWAMKHLDQLMVADSDTLRIRETLTPVRDTALSVIALAEAGEGPDSPSIRQGVRCLLAHESRRPGDWSCSVRGLEPGGWYTQHRNGFYPDAFTTATVLLALEKAGHSRTPAARSAVQRGLHWLLGMQNPDGGWAMFDRGTPSFAWDTMSFADPRGMGDASCADITGRVLECLGQFGYRLGHDCVRRAKKFLDSTQLVNGSWSGRLGLGCLFGTWSVLMGLEKVGSDKQEGSVRKAVHFLKSTQHDNGSWGEVCGEATELFRNGDPTPTQTAWALMGLIAAGDADSTAAQRGLNYLQTTQKVDGSWEETAWTACGVAPHTYGRNSLFPVCYPLIAVARCTKSA